MLCRSVPAYLSDLKDVRIVGNDCKDWAGTITELQSC